MKIIGLNGKTHTWNLTGHVPLLDDRRKRSSYHLLARQLLHELYPSLRILEEIPLPGSGGLTADFYIPQRKIVVEVHGEQHYKFVSHFHNSQLGFVEAKKRDKNKDEWCNLNNIRLIELPFDKSIDEWRLIIKGDGHECD